MLGRGVVHGGAGWLITALAVMLGALFWFDMLNQFMVIRSTVDRRARRARKKARNPSRPARRMPPLVAVALPVDQVALKEWPGKVELPVQRCDAHVFRLRAPSRVTSRG